MYSLKKRFVLLSYTLCQIALQIQKKRIHNQCTLSLPLLLTIKTKQSRPNNEPVHDGEDASKSIHCIIHV